MVNTVLPLETAVVAGIDSLVTRRGRRARTKRPQVSSALLQVRALKRASLCNPVGSDRPFLPTELRDHIIG
jgi:hypothetical protein